jgi:hypothetical protein
MAKQPERWCSQCKWGKATVAMTGEDETKCLFFIRNPKVPKWFNPLFGVFRPDNDATAKSWTCWEPE